MASESDRPQPIAACDLHARESQRLQPDRTPEPPSTPDEGTVRRECAEPVAWLAHSDEFQMVSLFREHAEAGATENEAAVVPLYRSPTLTDAEREAILYCVSCAQDYRDTLDGSEERATQMIEAAMRLAIPHVGPAPAERGGATSVTDVGGAGPILTDADVGELLAEAADEIERLRLAILRLAEQDATLSVCGGAVTVTMDATLTDAEREALEIAVEYVGSAHAVEHHAKAIERLLERAK